MFSFAFGYATVSLHVRGRVAGNDPRSLLPPFLTETVHMLVFSYIRGIYVWTVVQCIDLAAPSELICCSSTKQVGD